MDFVGREAELARLVKSHNQKAQQAILVYGRRRVGKSELIKRSISLIDMACVYYECKQTTETDNVNSLASMVSEALGYPRLAFDTIEEVLEFLFEQSADKPIAVVLDEYPYLREGCKGLDSVVQALLDRHRDTSNLHLILCGSYIDVMKSLLQQANPLYGRIDLTIDLRPMDYYESALFYPSFSAEDKVRLYSVFGGIPYYNRLIDQSQSVRENIIELIASPGARFENEVSLYLGSEISKIANANEVFMALARGFSKYSDILSQSHVSSGPAMVDVLEKLIRMELVQKKAPINDRNNKRKAGYHIVDSLSLFYYRYLFPRLSQMSVMEPSAFFDRFITEDFERRHAPAAFEEICRQYLVRRNQAGLVEPPFDDIGSYYYDDPANKTNGEFDVVTHDEQGYVFYEAKFRSSAVTQKMIDDEIEQVNRTGLECRKYGFFSRSGFKAKSSDRLELIDINEMYR